MPSKVNKSSTSSDVDASLSEDTLFSATFDLPTQSSYVSHPSPPLNKPPPLPSVDHPPPSSPSQTNPPLSPSQAHPLSTSPGHQLCPPTLTEPIHPSPPYQTCPPSSLTLVLHLHLHLHPTKSKKLLHPFLRPSTIILLSLKKEIYGFLPPSLSPSPAPLTLALSLLTPLSTLPFTPLLLTFPPPINTPSFTSLLLTNTPPLTLPLPLSSLLSTSSNPSLVPLSSTPLVPSSTSHPSSFLVPPPISPPQPLVEEHRSLPFSTSPFPPPLVFPNHLRSPLASSYFEYQCPITSLATNVGSIHNMISNQGVI